ncbi:phosphotransferase enzyme family-domain-containing protein [Microdochium bolleyi]|uniref:Phosphotransferase enzyme family-domain-containing protein n=1 Tax=Microdochium bolleyi TaxID=196109 RepID=A0A136J8F0_9PEZI|nr:phosphotransferase enzyme family-domain-containing protein [Microdochium bolleyi]
MAAPAPRRGSQDGLRWDVGDFDCVPVWTREPALDAIERVCRQELGVRAHEACKVSFFAAGAFNKLYLVEARSGNASAVLMRVSLPVYPGFKTRGEVATLRWVRRNTDIPVPGVIAFDDSNDNDIGFEWIIMQKMPGVPLYREWRSLPWEKKIAITTRVAEFQAQLAGQDGSRLFAGIGTLREREEQNNFDLVSGVAQATGTLACPAEPVRAGAGEDGARVAKTTRQPQRAGCNKEAKAAKLKTVKAMKPDRLVSHEFFLGDHVQYDIPRGPFAKSSDWLTTELQIIIHEQEAIISAAGDESDIEDADEVLQAARKLVSIIPRVFPPPLTTEEESREPTCLYHTDLNLSNILVDDDGEMTAIVDWECVSAMPLWLTTRMPKFLTDQVRDEEPIRDRYSDEASTSNKTSGSREDSLDNEGKNKLYWIHLMEYEVTQLSRVYEKTLLELWPAWPIQDSACKVDMYDAVTQCGVGFFIAKIDRWAEGVATGNAVRFNDA